MLNGTAPGKVYEDEAFVPGGETRRTITVSCVHDKCKNGPNMLAYMKEMGDVLKEYDDAFIVFEYYTDEQYGDEPTEFS